MFSISQTPAMFKPGIYDKRIYYDGSLEKSISGYSLVGGSESLVGETLPGAVKQRTALLL